MIEYEDHRWKQKKYEIAVEPRKFILFNSSYNISLFVFICFQKLYKGVNLSFTINL
jgi:hypothetical protein